MKEGCMILCIDDEPNVLITRKLVLQSAGYEVVTAASGVEGLRLFALRRPDAVVLDFFMPEMDGATVARLMKRSDPTVPIVMLSANIDIPSEAQGFVDDFVTKGACPPVLLGKLNALLGQLT
jgi:two-component system response regulator MprA